MRLAVSLKWLANVVLFLSLTSVAAAAGGFPQPTICQRSCWGARAAKSTPTQMASLTRAVIHHTANANEFNTTSLSTSQANVRSIQNVHMDVNGWADIGYHFLADKLGNRFEGRVGSMTSLPRGAHDGNNTNSFGFSMMGYFHSPHNQVPPLAQRGAIYDLIAWRMPNGYSSYGGGSYAGKSNVGFLCGHRDVGATACPGDTYYGAYLTTNLSGGEARNEVNSRIQSGGVVEVIVDNGTSAFTASSNWWTATATPGYYGSNYHVRGTAAVSDAATWRGNIPSTGNWEVYVRYTAGTNRASAAPYIVVHNGGNTTVAVNQQVNNGQWVSIGTYSFNSGSTADRVRLSCWTSSGDVVIADAVKYVRR